MNTKKLFSAKIQNYKVKTQKYGSINYVNLDNAATTPPLLAVQKGVDDYLMSYGSVHRGAETKSKISTDIYEESREIIRDFVNAPKDNYVIFTTNTTEAINTAAYFFSFSGGAILVYPVSRVVGTMSTSCSTSHISPVLYIAFTSTGSEYMPTLPFSRWNT